MFGVGVGGPYSIGELRERPSLEHGCFARMMWACADAPATVRKRHSSAPGYANQ